MKVTIISASYFAEENQKVIRTLANHIDVRVVVPAILTDPIHGTQHFRSAEGLRNRFLDFRSFPSNTSNHFFRTSTLGLAEFKPDIIQIEHNPWAPQYIQAILTKSVLCPSTKVIALVKKNTYRRLPPGMQMLKDCLAMTCIKRTDHFLAASKLTAKLLADTFGIAENNISVGTHLGVDTDLFRPVCKRHTGDQNFAIGYCGRLSPAKGIGELIEAVKILRSRLTFPVKLRLLGAWPNNATTPSEYSSIPWLDIIPPVTHGEVASFMQTLDVFVMPSWSLPDHQEHDGHALIEALCCGIPSVGTSTGIIPEILEDGIGLLVPERQPMALAEAIEQLATSPNIREELSARSRAKALKYWSIEAIARARISLYESVIRT